MWQKIFIVLRNGELYHGVNKKPKSVKAYTSRGMAEGVIKRDIGDLATKEYRNMIKKLDIKPTPLSMFESEIYRDFVAKAENEFSIKEIEI